MKRRTATTRSLRDRLAAVLAALSVIMVAGGLVLATSSTATAEDTVPCGTPAVAAYDETVVDVPAKAAYDETIHHDAVPAVTEVVHHDAVTETQPDQRYSWNPQGPEDEASSAPAWPEPAQGKWTANTSTYHEGDPLGVVFQEGGGNGGDNASWFYWTVKQVVTQEAYDETVVKVPAKDAYDETIHHAAVPAVTHVVHHAGVPAGPPCDEEECLPQQNLRQPSALATNGEADPCLVAPSQASVNPPTCLAAGSITDPAAQENVTVARTVLEDGSVRFVSTPVAGYHFAGADQSLEQVVKALPKKTGAACGEIRGEDGEAGKPRPKPSVKPAGVVAGTSATVAGTSADIAGTDASVPSSVNAGLAGASRPSTLQLVGQLLAGAGLLLFVGACWTGAARRRSVVGAL